MKYSVDGEPDSSSSELELTSNQIEASDVEGIRLKREVSSLFMLIEDHMKNVSGAHLNLEELKADKINFWSVFITIAVVSFVILIIKFTPPEFWLRFNEPLVIIQGLALFVYIVAAGCIVIQLYNARIYLGHIRKPTSESLKLMRTTTQHEIELFNQLENYSRDSIQYLSNRLNDYGLKVHRLQRSD